MSRLEKAVEDNRTFAIGAYLAAVISIARGDTPSAVIELCAGDSSFRFFSVYRLLVPRSGKVATA
jgi:hypothetical protein